MIQLDLEFNDDVDAKAKARARELQPSAFERNLVLDTAWLIRDLALWIGKCTVIANHFPAPPSQVDGVKFIRDSDPLKRSMRPKKGYNALTQQDNQLHGMASAPSSSQEPATASVFVPATREAPRRGRKRKLDTPAKIETRSNAAFREHWRAERIAREAVTPFAAPSISAAVRLQALRDRIATKRNCDRGLTFVPVT